MNRRPLQILRTLAEIDEEFGTDEAPDLVCDGSVCYFGCERVSRRTIDQLLWCLALETVSEPGDLERFAINGTGRAIARRPALADEVVAAVLEGTPFTTHDDKIVLMPVN